MKSWAMKKPPELVAHPMESQAYSEILAALTEILYQSLEPTPNLPDHDTTRPHVNQRKKGSS